MTNKSNNNQTNDQGIAVSAPVDDPVNKPVDGMEHISDSTDSKTEHKTELTTAERYPNLAPNFGRRKGQVAVESGRKGGKASGVTKRKRRLMRDAAQHLLSADIGKLPIPELDDLKLALKALGVEDITGADAIILAQAIKAARGDTEAARFVRDTSGEKPSVALDVTATDRAIDKDSVAELSDAELIALADGAEDHAALPPPMLQ